MTQFKGFSEGRTEMSQLPAEFFTELVPLIDDLAELKLMLFCFWALPQKEGKYRYLRRADFLDNQPLLDGLQAIDPAKSAQELLDQALNKALERGALLQATVTHESATETLFFVNTVLGRDAVAQINSGQYIPADEGNPVEILPPRLTIYKLYEDNIGMLTPIIADELKDMEKTFPPAWVEEGIRIAVQSNKRNLRYIRAILERWRTEGKDEGENAKGHSEQDGERYIRGKYADFIDH
ncbi:MAG: DnaD domain protein [Aggregatilineales bacterium]